MFVIDLFFHPTAKFTSSRAASSLSVPFFICNFLLTTFLFYDIIFLQNFENQICLIKSG